MVGCRLLLLSYPIKAKSFTILSTLLVVMLVDCTLRPSNSRYNQPTHKNKTQSKTLLNTIYSHVIVLPQEYVYYHKGTTHFDKVEVLPRPTIGPVIFLVFLAFHVFEKIPPRLPKSFSPYRQQHTSYQNPQQTYIQTSHQCNVDV